MRIKKSLSYLIILILVFPIVFSDNPYFGISFDCLESCKEGVVDVSKPIMLRLEIKNNFNYWISWGTEKQYGGSDFRILVENSNLKNGKDSIIYNDILDGPFFFKPKTASVVYLPLEIYNSLDEDQRLGEWRITPEFLLNDVRYFESPYNGKQIYEYNIQEEYRIPSSIKGNILKFEAKKSEVKVEVESDINIISRITGVMWDFVKEWAAYIISGIIIVVGGGIILYLFKKKK